jgi:hypothetical protein
MADPEVVSRSCGAWLGRWSAVSAWRSTEAALRGGVLTHADLTVAILTIIGVVVWWESSIAVPLLAMTDIGLASVLPPGTWVGILLVSAAFVVALKSGRTPGIVLSIVATVLVLHGLGVVAEPEMRFDVAWRHIGIADYFRTRGQVDPELDAYQNWPAFFAFAAFVWEATGLRDLPAVLAWTPVVYNLLYLLPLIAIGHRIVGDRMLVWLAAWLFTVSNWIGQDYFSPQGWYVFIYLVVLAVLLSWFGEYRPGLPDSGRSHVASELEGPQVGTTNQRLALLAVVLVLTATIVSGHQLTPYALTVTTAAAVAVGWCRLRTLPISLMLATLLWTGYAAAAYVAGHPDTFSQLGSILSIFEQTVEKRLQGSPGHELIVRLRLLETAALWALAAIGVFRLVRAGHRRLALSLASVALSCFLLMALQSYGGEALMRIAFFALAFTALLVAVALIGPPGALVRFRELVSVILVGVLLLAAFPLTRYGNERMDWYTSDEVAGVDAMYRVAPAGSVLTSVTGGLPWRSKGYDDYDYRVLVDGNPISSAPGIGREGTVDMAAPDLAKLAEQVESRMARRPGQRSFLIVSRSQAADLDLLGPFPAGAQDRLIAAVTASTAFRPVFRNPYVNLFELVGMHED